MIDQKYVTRAWSHIRNPSAFTSLTAIAKSRKVKDKEALRKVLSEIDSYSLHVPTRIRHKTRPILVSERGDTLVADLMDVSNLSRQNAGIHFLLVATDAFSRLTYIEPLKSKSTKDTTPALETILKRFKYKFKRFFADDGSEWKGSFRAKLNELGIRRILVKSLRKASPAESRIHMIRSRLERYLTHYNTKKYIDILPDLEKAINESFSRSIGMAPVSVTLKNQDLVWFNIYKSVVPRKVQNTSLQKGDIVRLNRYRESFRKSTKVGWSNEKFKIVDKKNSFGIWYFKLQDLDSPPSSIPGSYYTSELLKVG